MFSHVEKAIDHVNIPAVELPGATELKQELSSLPEHRS